MTSTVLVTGGLGFIGSALVRHLIEATQVRVVNVDKVTYAANPASLADLEGSPRYRFVQADICDAPAMAALIAEADCDVVMHLAAETHVDRSIDGPMPFVQTNVVGTAVLLSVAQAHWDHLPAERKARFRFHHISTDEVFGSLGETGFFDESTSYAPNSPYSASKAGSDHLVRAWQHTYGLPVLITNCSNNYGPRQFPEKLIPLTILNALEGRPLPVYGKGANVRDWLHVEDHVRGLWTVVQKGRPGETYCIGTRCEKRNIEIVETIADLLDGLAPRLPTGTPRRSLITFVKDRPGHDARYAIDCTKIERDLGWKPRETFESGLESTLRWYLDNRSWWEPLRGAASERLGLKTDVRTA